LAGLVAVFAVLVGGIVWFPVDTALTAPVTVSVLAATAVLAAFAARRAGEGSNLTTTRTRTWRADPRAGD
jgi:hypothetical protein